MPHIVTHNTANSIYNVALINFLSELSEVR